MLELEELEELEDWEELEAEFPCWSRLALSVSLEAPDSSSSSQFFPFSSRLRAFA